MAAQYASQVGPAGQVRKEAGALDERADRAEHVGTGMHRAALHRDLAAVRLDQPDDHPQRRRLARAVRAEQADDLAALGGERHPVHGPQPVGEA